MRNGHQQRKCISRCWKYLFLSVPRTWANLTPRLTNPHNQESGDHGHSTESHEARYLPGTLLHSVFGGRGRFHPLKNITLRWKTSTEKSALQSEWQAAPQLRDFWKHVTTDKARYPKLVLIPNLLRGNCMIRPKQRQPSGARISNFDNRGWQE